MSFPLLLITALLQPFYSAIIYFVSLPKRYPQIKDFIVIVFIISLIGIYWYPWGDNQTHFVIYYTDIINKYGSFSLADSYFLYDYVIALIAKSTGQYVYGLFFWLYIPLIFFFTLTWKSLANCRRDYVLLFIMMILIVGVRELLDLNRNTAAGLFIISGLFILQKSKIASISLFVISCLLHSTSILIIVILFVFKYLIISRTKSIKYVVIVCLIVSLFSTTILYSLGSERVINSYATGVWGQGGSGVNSRFAYIVSMTNLIMFVIFAVHISKNFIYYKKSPILPAYLATFSLGIIFWTFWLMRERFIMINTFSAVAVIISGWKYLPEYKIKSKAKRYCNIIIGLCLLRFMLICGQTYSSRYIHKNESSDPNRITNVVMRFTYCPTLFLLDVQNFGFNDNMYLEFKRVNTGIDAER